VPGEFGVGEGVATGEDGLVEPPPHPDNQSNKTLNNRKVIAILGRRDILDIVDGG
jgi:hypothetical protein